MSMPAPPSPVVVLDPSLQAERIDLGPVRCWGSVARSTPLPGGTWHCYTWDYRFSGLLRRPDRLAATGPYAAVEPNLSTWPAMPADEVRRLTLAKRRTAAAWQARGVRIWVDLNVAPNHARPNLVGVPAGWRSFATRAHRDTGLRGLLADYETACNFAEGGEEAVRFLVIGGSPTVRDLCAARGWSWAVEHSDRVRGRERGRERVRVQG